MKIDDVYIYTFAGIEYSVIITQIINTYSPFVQNKVKYLFLPNDRLNESWSEEESIDSFERHFIFSQKLTDEYLIKDIIE